MFKGWITAPCCCGTERVEGNKEGELELELVGVGGMVGGGAPSDKVLALVVDTLAGEQRDCDVPDPPPAAASVRGRGSEGSASKGSSSLRDFVREFQGGDATGGTDTTPIDTLWSPVYLSPPPSSDAAEEGGEAAESLEALRGPPPDDERGDAASEEEEEGSGIMPRFQGEGGGEVLAITAYGYTLRGRREAPGRREFN